jgi:YHS domain-containing protein
MPHARGFGQSYTIRPTACPNGQCRVSTATFGFNDTDWRQWPMQPRPEQRDAKTIGGVVIPTPPAIIEQPLPRADSVPSKPALPGGNTGGSILPFPGLTPGATDGNAAPGPGTSPAGSSPQLPAPEGLHMPLDFGPAQPGVTSKSDGSGGSSPIQPKATPIPGLNLPDTTTPIPSTPGRDLPKAPEKENPPPKSLDLAPDPLPSPAPKADEISPAKPAKSTSTARRYDDQAAAKPRPLHNELPIRANWNASLAAEMVVDSQLRRTSFQQHTSSEASKSLRANLNTTNPLRSAMGGYCPVQLRENDRWVAGKPDLRTSYQGLVYLFASDAALRRFEAEPEKYAPVRGGDDVVLAAEENRTAPGSVNHSAVWRGRLYLFANSKTLATFQEDPDRYIRESR